MWGCGPRYQDKQLKDTKFPQQIHMSDPSNVILPIANIEIVIIAAFFTRIFI